MTNPTHSISDRHPDVVDVNTEAVDLTEVYQRLLQYYGPQYWWPAEHSFEVIVGAILTQNTAWINVEKALSNLRSNGLLSISAISNTSPDQLQAVIRPAGFYRRKAECLHLICQWLESNQTELNATEGLRLSLLNITGIGPETADAILLYAFNKTAFVVDKYTHRIISRLTAQQRRFDYAQLQAVFVDQLDKSIEVYREYHALIVAHAKAHCKKIPDCASCPINDICSEYRCNIKP